MDWFGHTEFEGSCDIQKKLYKYSSTVKRKCQDRAIISDVIKMLIAFEIVGMSEFDQMEGEEYE